MNGPPSYRMDQASGKTGSVADQASNELAKPSAPKQVRHARDRLVRLAYRFLWNLDEAEDVAHEALAVAEEQRLELRESGRWWSWVSRIVVNRCHSQGRKQQVWKRHAEAIGRGARRFEDQVDEPFLDARGQALRDALDQLPRRQREVMVLRHLQDMSFERVAEVLGISSSTARVHARDGRESLRRVMLERNPDWFGSSRRQGGVT